VWLAIQDGSGPWTVVTPVNNAYSFNITTRGGVTYVLSPTVGTSTVSVQFFTKAEFGTTLVLCPSPGVLKTVNGTVAGVGATEAAHVSLGGGSTFVNAFTTVGFPNFQITSVASGSQDLVASHRPSFTGLADKGIIRRGLNIANNGSIGATLDFTMPEAFSLNSATFTITGLTGGESITQDMTYLGASCLGGALYSGVSVTGSSFTAVGVPAAQQVAGDFHGVSLFVRDPATNMTRITNQFFQAFGARTVPLAAVFPTPTVTSLGGPYKRLQAVYTLPADYQQSTSLVYVDQTATGKAVSMNATLGYLGSTAVTLALADYSALAGWDNNWAPGSSNTANWTVGGAGGNATSGFCTTGARLDFGQVSGSN
jgi:hypothetical protein